VSGWAKGEYDQMGLWPGDDYFGYRYEYSTEYSRAARAVRRAAATWTASTSR